MYNIFRKPLFWILFSALAIASTFFTLKYFSTAFPIVNLDLELDRPTALKKAREISEQYNLGPIGYWQAASFESDQEVQTFVELEAGGKQAFTQMLKDQLYAPYTWQVRHFKEYEKNETRIKFKPDGTPYGFAEKISENSPGHALSTDQAKLIAEQAATNNWRIQLTNYKLVETSKEVRPSGRIDHQFTYERPDITIGNGHYRLQLILSGDKLTELTHYIKIPEEFKLRYKEMRSANNSIAAGATMAMILLYIFGGCIIGIFFLLRRRWVLWKTATAWGIIIATLHVLVSINQLPLAWMHYQTELSMQGFLIKYMVSLIFQLLYITILYSLAFITAESFTRAAFGKHPQLWDVWSPPASSSITILGSTIGGYLLVPCYLAFGVGFYSITTTYFNWWIPSSSLIDPNILAHYFPWLSSIVLSLGAGFMEECLFRAIPIAGAALIGKRFGNQRMWITLGFIVQALIFGAAHANYPAQPAYARVIELLFFSLISGGIYLRFGLLPTIISHFSYDVVWFALPLFVSTAPNAWINQAMVIMLAIIPLLIVLYARLKVGRWNSLPENELNESWQPPVHQELLEKISTIFQQPITLPSNKKNILIAACIIGLSLWLYTQQWSQDAQPLNVTPSMALTTAQQALANRNILLNESWQPLSNVSGDYTSSLDVQLQHAFIWQHGSPEIYHTLLGTYLAPPRWTIRYVRWHGTVAERSEEYQMSITGDNQLFRFKHQLPETFPGADLAEQDARLIAHQELQTTYQLSPESLQEISAVATKNPTRKDWAFTFSNKATYPLKQGQAYISVKISGDKVVDSCRYIHVPEEWERTQKNNHHMLEILSLLCMLLLYSFLSIGLVMSLKKSKHFSLFSGTTLGYSVVLIVLFALNLINVWPTMMAQLTTSEPFYNQIFNLVGMASIGMLFRAGSLGILLTYINAWQKPYHHLSHSLALIAGISTGAFATGIYTALQKHAPSLKPIWADYTALPTHSTLIGILIHWLTSYIALTAALLIVCIIIDHLSDYWHNNKVACASIFILFGVMMNDITHIENISHWLISGALMGLVLLITYAIIVRYDNTVVPIAAGTFIISLALQQAAFNAYPMAYEGNLLACIMIIAFMLLWAGIIRKQ
ncbi:MAG: type II CAAX endopeptidase family protein [Candidatus Dependentiae bacterium]|nr:type II CAAX endopeptidase family protein [Candidatus Dependentiae bacterium]